nr:GDP-mannose 4,6-dehydratase [Anaerolineae bacterium]
GQGEDFVVAALALQIARIEAGRQSVLHVGNLSARRDFTDVRDMVRAYHALMQHGQPGEVYNIASGTAHSIDSILQSLRTSATVPVSIQIDTSRLRPSDIPVIQGDATRLHRLTGWQPQITIEQTLRDLLQDCRQRVH